MAVASSVALFSALAVPVIHDGQGNWRRLQRQRSTVAVGTVSAVPGITFKAGCDHAELRSISTRKECSTSEIVTKRDAYDIKTKLWLSTFTDP
jgi:hypothetical protein